MRALKAILTLASCVMLLCGMLACTGGGAGNAPEINWAQRAPDTGQTTCYDLFDNSETPCTGTGQDGEFAKYPMDLTLHYNGSTVKDEVTLLMWQSEDDNQTYNWYQAAGVQDSVYNPTGIDVCGSLSLAGFHDWRLPNEKELMDIVNYGFSNPAIDGTYFPDTNVYFYDTLWSGYWTSRTTAGYAANAWLVHFSDGQVGWEGKTFNFYVRCVRGDAATPKVFDDNGDGTITDRGTGLVWQQVDDDTTRSWPLALAYCSGLSLAGHTDWRLPDVKELHSIVDSSTSGIATYNSYLPNTNPSGYWSSTTYNQASTRAWFVSFDYGYTMTNSKTDSLHYVRCVR